MKTVAGPGAAKIAVPQTLQARYFFLRADSGAVKYRMRVIEFTHDVLRRYRPRRIQRHQHRLGKRQRLQHIQEVMQAHLAGLALRVACTLVVPRGPGQLVGRKHRGVGVKHCAVRLVADGAQHSTFGHSGLLQQGERLVGMGRQHHFVEAFFLTVGNNLHSTAGRQAVPAYAFDRRVQTFVGDTGNNFVHVMPGPTGDCPPLGAVGNLDQPVVVAKTDHRCHRKLQHLVGWARPDAAEHGQKVPVTKLGAVIAGEQKVAQWLQHGGLSAVFGQGSRLTVEAHDVAQHAQEPPIQQIAALGKYRVQAGAAPFKRATRPAARYLDEKRHVRVRCLNAQFGKQCDQPWVGALVEHQKTGVNAVCQRALWRWQGDVHRVGVAPEIGVSFKQSDVGVTA